MTSPADLTCQREMPKYRSHKVVHALKIRSVLRPFTDGPSVLSFEDDRYAGIEVDAAWVRKHEPHPGGYYVAYPDGYTSFSPAAAFEAGYTPIDREPPAGWPVTRGRHEHGRVD